MRALIMPGIFVSVLALASCAPASGDAPGDSGRARAGSGGGGNAGNVASGGGGAATTGGTSGVGGVDVAPSDRAVGFVVIDAQKTFVDGAANGDIASILEREKNDFQLAAAANVPFFITFEGSTVGDHALAAELAPALPPQAQQFVKTTFDATGQPAFAAAVKQSGLSHLVVVGSETDVCVMQTVLGLRTLGFSVLLQKDAVFTSEPNTSPAVRRMQQAGVLAVDASAVAAYAAQPSTLPPAADVPVKVVKPLHLGVVLDDFDDAAFAASSDPLKAQKVARLRELLLVSEWFELPVYVTNPAAGLPSALAQYFQGQLRPSAEIAQDGDVLQLVFAGTDGGLADALSAWQGSRDLFVMEDALLALGTPDAQKALLGPFFDQGLVPTTYKSFYYDMTKSIDVSQWPSPVWGQRFDEYYAITQAPEDLPPMPPS